MFQKLVLLYSPADFFFFSQLSMHLVFLCFWNVFAYLILWMSTPVMVLKSPHSRKQQCGYLANPVVLFGRGGTGALSRVYITKNVTEWSWKNSVIWFLSINLWLQTIFQRREAKSEPINSDDIDCSCEWPSEIESLPPLMDDSWLDDFPLQCRGSP